MNDFSSYSLFLFDFDGLLVNTEEIHFEAYKKMCRDRDIDLNWSFARYCEHAHYSSQFLREQIFTDFPALQAQEPSWEILYKEKKKAMSTLVEEGAVHLMPGAERLLKELAQNGRKMAVVTHSPTDLVHLIREQQPLLNVIPHWITREHYNQPKPNPECYQVAIELLANPDEKVVGFEDSPRGIQALLGSRALPVLVTTIFYPEIVHFESQGVKKINTLQEVSI